MAGLNRGPCRPSGSSFQAAGTEASGMDNLFLGSLGFSMRWLGSLNGVRRWAVSSDTALDRKSNAAPDAEARVNRPEHVPNFRQSFTSANLLKAGALSQSVKEETLSQKVSRR